MSEKTFPPSIEKLQKARKNGEVAVSKVLTLAVGVLTAGGAIWWQISSIRAQGIKFEVPEVETAHFFFAQGLLKALQLTLIPLVAAVFGTVVTSLFQTKGLLHFGALQPKLKQMGPLGWWRRGVNGFSDGSLGVVRVVFLLVLLFPVWVHGSSLVQEILRLSAGYGVSWEGSALLFNYLVMGSVIRLGIGVTLLGVCSYGIVKWRFMKKMMMSLHEVKEECREQEGDPHVKAARRHEHEALLMKDLAARVRRAKVIVVERRPV